MDDKNQDSGKSCEELSKDTPLKVDHKQEEEGIREDLLYSSFDKIDLTSKPKIIISKSKTDGNTKNRPSSSQKNIAIHLEPSLGEKLAKKKAVADELEDKLQTLQSNFKGKLQSVDRIKQELKNQEAHLLQSVQKIEGYMRQIYSLKRESDDTFERLKSSSMQLALDFCLLTREYNNSHSIKQAAIVILEYYRPAQSCLRNVICGLNRYSSVKELVEYYLVLELLREDLLEEDQRRLKDAESNAEKQRNIATKARNLPLDILAKEEILYKIQDEEKDLRLKNIELEQQVRNLLSAKAKEETMWHDVKRWISKTYKNICEIMAPDISEPKDSVVDQLQSLQDFVFMGNKLVERLQKVLKN